MVCRKLEMDAIPMIKWNPNRDSAAEPEGEIDNPNDFKNHSSLVNVAKIGMKLLHTHYPDWPWGLQINEFGRVIHIFNLALHDTWGYTIRADEVEHLRTLRMFIRAGGEILERFGLRAGRFDLSTYAAVKKDPRGRCIPVYLSDLEIAAAKKEIRKRALAEAVEKGNFMIAADGTPLVAIH